MSAQVPPGAGQARLPDSASDLERELVTLLKWSRIQPEAFEYRFHPTRKWRFDMAWPSINLAVEVEGGLFATGHRSLNRFRTDLDKYNAAALAGWTVLRFTEEHIRSGEAVQLVQEALL